MIQEEVSVDPTDTQLLTAYRTGSTTAFQVLHARYRDHLFLYARALMRDDDVAEDLVQDTFLRLLNSGAAGERLQGKLGAFLHVTLRRLAIDRRRSQASMRRREQAVSRPWICATARDTDQEQVDQLNAALVRLPQEQLEVVVLRQYSGLSFSEIASALEAPLSTILSRHAYALRKLAESIRGSHE
jgi:RNA polymerase sigma-70 factor (ECF subfamily)